MAQLKDTLVSGSLRATDSLLSVTAQFKILEAPTASNGDTYGPGTNGHILISNGTSAYWGTTTAITQVGTITSGTWQGTTIDTAYGGTGNNTGFTQWGIIYANPVTKLISTSAGSSGYLLQGNGSAAPDWIQATNANIINTIVKRDGTGNFSAGTITATLSGNADTATQVKVTNFGLPSSGNQVNYITLSNSTTTGNQDIKNTSNLYLWENTTTSYLNVGTTGTTGAITLHNGTGLVNIIPTTLTANTTRVLTVQDADGTICLTDGTGASGTWGISITGSAAKLGTATVGDSNQPIYLNAGTATAVSWYYNSCSINGGNQANYPWHRFATCTTSAGQWIDKSVIVIINSRFDGGGYGMVKLSIRTNANNAAKSTSAVWIYRRGFAVDDIKISAPTKTTGTDETINAYIRCSTYPRRIAYILEGSNNGWSLVSSNEPNDTTASDKKGGTEINASVSGNNATDGATVSYANSAGSIAWNGITDKPSTFAPSSHTHNSLVCIGSTSGESGRTAARGGLYSYNWYSGGPSSYLSVVGFGMGTGGHAEIAVNWTGTSGMWLRSLRDTADNWWSWNRVWVSGNSITNAVWNDLAECRKSEVHIPGYAITQDGKYTTKRLEPGCRITSDTWGFALGNEEDKDKMPVAISGRVLAYPYRSKEEYHLGDCVCSAPDGKVDIMTRQEIRDWPECIIGIVNEIPDYEEWGAEQKDNTGRDKIKVNGRIWIDIK